MTEDAGSLPTIGLDLSPNEASGLLLIRNQDLLDTHRWDRGFWVVLDEGPVEQCIAVIGHRRGMPVGGGWGIERLTADAPGGAETKDAEALGRSNGWIYIFGSHFGGKAGPLQPERGFVARFREDEAGDLSHVRMEISRHSFVVHRLVNDALRALGPPIKPLHPRSREAFITATRDQGAELVHADDVPINVEGAAFRSDGSLLLGLRYPVAADGRPLLVDLDEVDALFADGTPTVRGFWRLGAIGRGGAMAGVRDLDLDGDELHVVTGNIDAREKGSVLLADHPEGQETVSTHWRCRLPAGARDGDLDAERVREFPAFPRIEGIAVDDEGGFFYVSDEDEHVLVRCSTPLLVENPPVTDGTG